MFWTSVCPIHNMSSFLQFSYHLGLPLAIVHWKATIWKNCSLLKSYIKLYSTQNGYGHVCVPYTTWLEAHEGECYHWTSSCYSNVSLNWSIKYQNFGSRQVCCMSNCEIVSHTQHFVSYTMVCLCFCVLLYSQKLTFFF